MVPAARLKCIKGRLTTTHEHLQLMSPMRYRVGAAYVFVANTANLCNAFDMFPIYSYFFFQFVVWITILLARRIFCPLHWFALSPCQFKMFRTSEVQLQRITWLGGFLWIFYLNESELLVRVWDWHYLVTTRLYQTALMNENRLI